jgi:hypothetical protein
VIVLRQSFPCLPSGTRMFIDPRTRSLISSCDTRSFMISESRWRWHKEEFDSDEVEQRRSFGVPVKFMATHRLSLLSNFRSFSSTISLMVAENSSLLKSLNLNFAISLSSEISPLMLSETINDDVAPRACASCLLP